MGGGGVVGFGLVCQVGPSLGSERGVFGPGGGLIFMQNFALTVFNARSSVMIYEMHTRLAREEPSDKVSHHD